MRSVHSSILALLVASSACADGADGPSDARARPLSARIGDVVSGEERTIVPHPSWTCGMPDGIPPPRLGTPAFEAEFEVVATREVGDTPYGKRSLRALGAGTVSGPSLEAKLLPGGIELPLILPNGTVELEQMLALQGTRGEYIYLRVCGVAPSASEPVRVVMDFEAPSSAPYARVNTAKLVGTRTLSDDGKKLVLAVYDVTDVALPAAKVAIENPAEVRDQTWDCQIQAGKRGPEVFRETVGILSQLSVGASKRGVRSIIPITGGTTAGRVAGRILALGYDAPLFGASITIDARYAIEAGDGELVVVRNCGPIGGLAPVFEARSSGPYAFLNENKWLSSDPAVGVGAVTITFFEKL